MTTAAEESVPPTPIPKADDLANLQSDAQKGALDANAFVLTAAPPTIRYIPNFLTEKEEEDLLRHVYEAPKPKWEQLKERRLQNWGGIVGRHGLFQANDIPPWLQAIMDRVAAVGNGFSSEHQPNHVLINEYLPGQGIMPHTDGPAFHPLISTVTLGSHAFLDFYTPIKEDDPDTSLEARRVGSVLLERGSLIMVTENSYRHHLHAIANRTDDVVTDKLFNKPEHFADGDVLKRSTRNVANVQKAGIFKLLKGR